MPSTHKRRLSDFLKPFAKSSTFNFATVETQTQELTIDLSASTTDDIAILRCPGPVAVQAIYFVPTHTTNTDNGTNFWQAQIFDRGTNGLGSTQLGATVTTNAITTTKYISTNLYLPTNELVLPDADVLTLKVTKNSAPQNNYTGLVVVSYIALMDA